MLFRKKKDKRILRLTAEEARLLRTALLRFRNKCLQAGKPTEDIDGLLMMICKQALGNN